MSKNNNKNKNSKAREIEKEKDKNVKLQETTQEPTAIGPRDEQN